MNMGCAFIKVLPVIFSRIPHPTSAISPDGMLVRILDQTDEFYRVAVDSFNQELYVPKNYIDPDNALSQATHVVIVDRNQQNQAAFEISAGEIRMVSYTLATTGLKGQSSFETPLGFYRAIEKKIAFSILRTAPMKLPVMPLCNPFLRRRIYPWCSGSLPGKRRTTGGSGYHRISAYHWHIPAFTYVCKKLFQPC